jgi:predicted dehydrogenase
MYHLLSNCPKLFSRQIKSLIMGIQRKMNWGIIGLGKIARKFAADLQIVPDARLHAVASTSRERSTAFAQQFNVPHAFDSYQALLECPDLDVVYIATPHTLHCENTLMCLERKIPVLCEKPAGMNPQEVHKMVTTATLNHTFLMEAMWTQFIPAFKKSMSLLASGVIGKPLSIKADFGFAAPYNVDGRAFNKDLGGGSLLDIGIYPVFLALEIFGQPIDIQAFAQFSPTAVDTTCAILFKHEKGALSMLHSTFTSLTNTEAYIYGEQGTIHIHPRFHHPEKISLHVQGKPVKEFSMPYQGNGYQFEIEEVNRCLRKKLLESPLMPLEKSVRLAETLYKIREKIGLVYPKQDVF